jgi:hypothetical protein
MRIVRGTMFCTGSRFIWSLFVAFSRLGAFAPFDIRIGEASDALKAESSALERVSPGLAA